MRLVRALQGRRCLTLEAIRAMILSVTGWIPLSIRSLVGLSLVRLVCVTSLIFPWLLLLVPPIIILGLIKLFSSGDILDTIIV